MLVNNLVLCLFRYLKHIHMLLTMGDIMKKEWKLQNCINFPRIRG